jgi:hypothetical protein
MQNSIVFLGKIFTSQPKTLPQRSKYFVQEEDSVCTLVYDIFNALIDKRKD